MLLEGAKPDKVGFLTALESCSSSSSSPSARSVRTIHGLILAAGLQSVTFLGNALANLYGRAGRLDEAELVFESIAHKDVVSWNTMITVLARAGNGERALELFQRMIHERRDVVSWNAIIRAYSQHGHRKSALEMFRRMQHECSVAPNEVTFVSVLGAAEEASELRMIHDRAAENGFHSSNVFVGNSLVHMHGKCGSVHDAKQLFDAMALQSVSSWNSIVDAYAHNGLEREAFKLFRTMQHEGVRPDKVTFLTVLEVCTSLRQVRLLQELVTSAGLRSDVLLQTALLQVFARNSSISDAKRTFDGVRDKDLFAWNTLLTAYAQCSRLEQAKAAFDRMEEKNLVSWNALASAYVQNAQGDAALELLASMQLEGTKPDRVTFFASLDACFTDISQVRMLHAQISRIIHRSIAESGFLSDVIIDNTLINMYGKCGSPREARRVFDSMRERALVSWNSIVTVAAQHGEVAEARKLFRGLQQEGLKPDNVALMSVASVCQHVGLLEEAFYYLFQLGTEYRVTAKRERYSCIVGLLGRIGWLEEAEAVIRKMPFKPNEAVWKNLLMSCKIHNDVARGARVAKELLELDSADSATYVTLYNMYAGQLKHSEEPRDFELDELEEAGLDA
ncbi:hypothetical protein SELMODRAFT_97233 [Selaginella moellendorffii]|uniref:Pentacotripeptide-repeat region of PRORP domain-containing protein n=1 Tax=Selaginella moellendorffii TaxID=88036 RepID=D8RN89_SELML|nr:hypothetical protein SELMODRAFT_97233 [Selaginella moellendorffii]